MSSQSTSSSGVLNDSFYLIRVQVALIAAEIIMLALFRYYPVHNISKDDLSRFSAENESPVVMEEVVITEQSQAMSVAPPVPRDLPPEPTDEFIEMEPLDIGLFEPPENGPIANIQNTGQSDTGELEPVANPDIPPQLYKIVEPVTPQKAREAKVKARIRVSFLISAEGEVVDLSITRIEVFDSQKQKFVTRERVGYGLAEAVLKAASQWQFGPAQNGGDTVPAMVEHIFTFGTD